MMRGEIEEGDFWKKQIRIITIPEPNTSPLGRLGGTKLKKIMEKKYIKPEIQVVEIELQPMMAASTETMGIYGEEVEGGLSKEHESRGFDVWGLDEE